MRERDPHFAKAITEIEKGIEESFKKAMDQKKVPEKQKKTA